MLQRIISGVVALAIVLGVAVLGCAGWLVTGDVCQDRDFSPSGRCGLGSGTCASGGAR